VQAGERVRRRFLARVDHRAGTERQRALTAEGRKVEDDDVRAAAYRQHRNRGQADRSRAEDRDLPTRFYAEPVERMGRDGERLHQRTRF
jgi:hypothetical protein